MVELVAELLLIILRVFHGPLGHDDRRLRTMVVRADGRVDSGPALDPWKAWLSEIETWITARANLLCSRRGERRAACRWMAFICRVSPWTRQNPFGSRSSARVEYEQCDARPWA